MSCNYQKLDEISAVNTHDTCSSCFPLGVLMACLGAALSCCRWPSERPAITTVAPPPLPPVLSEKKIPYQPTHAAMSYLKTTTTREIRRANEIL
ncbi:hypothetical protein VTJ04DRAFT_1791 [Mycothermus thermophilus]|uniref:uncharacterized protein n=1 Tax=Humicola insolens TaxID=85995 RepID=UPI00374472AF